MSATPPHSSAGDEPPQDPRWASADPERTTFHDPFFPHAERTAPPPPLPPAHRRRTRRAVVIALAAGVVVLIVLLALLRGFGLPGPRIDAQPSTGAIQFLQAVAAGDADAALAMQEHEPRDRTLLTDAVLDRSGELAPISRIEVVMDTDEQVELRYLLGDQEVHARFDPVRQRDGSYKVERGTTAVLVSRPNQIGVFVNGVLLTDNEVDVFPGRYELTTGLETIEYSDPWLSVSGPETKPHLAPSPQLSARGTEAFLAATRDRLAECLESTEVNPPGCPQSLTIAEGTQVDESSVQWTVEGDPLAAVTPKLTLNDETVAEVRLSVRARLRAAVTTPTGPGMVNQSATFNSVATGQVATEPIRVRFIGG